MKKEYFKNLCREFFLDVRYQWTKENIIDQLKEDDQETGYISFLRVLENDRRCTFNCPPENFAIIDSKSRHCGDPIFQNTLYRFEKFIQKRNENRLILSHVQHTATELMLYQIDDILFSRVVLWDRCKSNPIYIINPEVLK